MTEQIAAEATVLYHKLDRIRSHIRTRLEVVDPVTAAELNYILNMIEEWEYVPSNWTLSEPIVPIKNRKVEGGNNNARS